MTVGTLAVTGMPRALARWIKLCGLALIAVAFSVMISSRVNDPRAAQNLSGVLVVPFLALFAGQLVGLVVVSPAFVLAFAAALTAVAALTIWLATRLFARETILTRWK